jgi:hypothetical protein
MPLGRPRDGKTTAMLASPVEAFRSWKVGSNKVDTHEDIHCPTSLFIAVYFYRVPLNFAINRWAWSGSFDILGLIAADMNQYFQRHHTWAF